MNKAYDPTIEYAEIAMEFQRVFSLQQAAWKRNRNPGLEERRADLRTIHRMLVDHEEELVAAVNRDYGCRSSFETQLTEILQALDAALDAIKQLKHWMKPQKRRLSFTQYPLASAWTFPQPVGVVGIVVPWNFPIAMVFQPLICAFAAGNRAMVKMSENSIHLAAVLRQIAPQYFHEEKLAFFEDGNGSGPAFTRLPFDHLFFTGSAQTGRAVMANAALNLTPVTLELGGKSPCVIAPDYPLRRAAERIMWVKMLNAGQICTNVDYLFVPDGKVDEFVREAQRVASARYPDIMNGDYTAIIDQRNYERIENVIADARTKGARVVNLCPGQRGDPTRRIMPPHAVIDVSDDMEIMRREVFGPLLPIRTYRSEAEVVEYIGSRPRPLALYLYSHSRCLQDYYLNNTISGGVTINDGLLHAGIHDLPFGGTGESGMGHYHGLEGFLTFSKVRPVFRQSPWRSIDMLMPPYDGKARRILALMMRKKR